MKTAGNALLFALAMILSNGALARAQTPALTVLYNFTGDTNGSDTWAGLLLAGNTLYGTTTDFSSTNSGTVFSVGTDGSNYTTMHVFTNSPDGYRPYAGLLLLGDTLYGTTAGGGDTNVSPIPGGIVFSVKTNGTGYQVLHSFTVAEGQFPHGRLVASGNTLFGTTLGAGSTGWGALFSMSTDGSNFNVLHTFSTPTPDTPASTNWDGDQPWAGLVLSGDTLYGTAQLAGPGGSGTVFSINTNGMGFTVLHAFPAYANDPVYGLTNSDGANLQGGLILSGSTLFGTSKIGGIYGGGTVYSLDTDGTNFAVLHHFSTNSLDGHNPWAELVLSGDTLYGTSERGGSNKKGTVFSLSTNGTGFTVVHSFTNSPDPAYPAAGLILSGNTLYGTTEKGGNPGFGTVFSLKIPVPVFGITSLHLAGAQLDITATNGAAGRAYTLLTSSNPALSLNQWTPLATKTLSNSGSFTISATNAASNSGSRAFFILRTTN